MALLIGSVLTASMLIYSAFEGFRILQGWNLQSGSEKQLDMERKTYLISTLMSYSMGFELLSLFLFIYTADSLSPLFVGAMCAAGSFQVNGFGYPALLLKFAACLLAGLWLIVNHTDNKAYDYPLTRFKYRLLLMITPLLLAGTIVEGLYLLALRPNIITSCCGVLFSSTGGNIMSNLLALPLLLSEVLFFGSVAICLLLGIFVCLQNRAIIFFSLSAFSHLIISITALISFISIYFYELPSHHCPFCILHGEYYYIGYPLYGALLIAAITGIGTGLIHPFGRRASLSSVVPSLQKRLALISSIATSIFVLIVGCGIWSSNLSMHPY